MAHESGYGGLVTTSAGYPWEAPAAMVQDWTVVDRYGAWDVTVCGGANFDAGGELRSYSGNTTRRRAKMLGTEDEISVDIGVLVPGSWATGPATGFKAGITPITVNLFKNASERITVIGFIDFVRIVSPLEGATLMRLGVTGDGSAPTFA